jgi:hypothetical protein
MRCVGHVAHKGENKNAYGILVGKPEGTNYFEYLSVDRIMILK